MARPCACWTAARTETTFPLLTPRLELRRFVDADLGALEAIFGDARVMRYVGSEGKPLGREQLVRSQERVREHWGRHGFGPLACVERASGGLVGEAGLQLLEAGPDVELTYTFAQAAWGRGYATEAARAILSWGFGELDLPRIVAVVYPRNKASLHVLEKLAMTACGPRDCYGRRLASYALTAAEWHEAATVSARGDD